MNPNDQPTVKETDIYNAEKKKIKRRGTIQISVGIIAPFIALGIIEYGSAHASDPVFSHPVLGRALMVIIGIAVLSFPVMIVLGALNLVRHGRQVPTDNYLYLRSKKSWPPRRMWSVGKKKLKQSAINNLKATGRKVTGQLAGIQSYVVRGKYGPSFYHEPIVTADLGDGENREFISDALTSGQWVTASQDFADNPIPLDVYIDIANPKRYYVDYSGVRMEPVQSTSQSTSHSTGDFAKDLDNIKSHI
ncbi:hypothetical protein FWF93_02710 [Candidatus Saccharibacteria bacterium]|nr:hypothetical protein [Candidatus Saccharibacteria bacterium]